jgi:hypothetical protein
MAPEPTITINGTTLTNAQAMAVRVAVSNFQMECAEPEFREGIGEIADAYQARLGEVVRLMLAHGEASNASVTSNSERGS